MRRGLQGEGSRRPRAASPLQQELDLAPTSNTLKAVWSEATRNERSRACYPWQCSVRGFQRQQK